VNAGGTLVALGEASRWLTREKVGLLGTKTELRDGRPETEPPADEKEEEKEPPAKEKDKDAKPEPFELEKAIQPERERPDAVPAALLRVTLDPEHWLAAGTDGEIHAKGYLLKISLSDPLTGTPSRGTISVCTR
jgi:hypothetical protein